MILLKKRNAMESVSYLSFCIPALLFYLTFYVYPTLSGFYYSLTDWTSMKNEINFIGLKNFMEAFGDKDLLNSIAVTLTYTVIMTAFQNLLGLFLALAVDMKLKASKLYKIIIFLPYVLPTVVSSNIWVYIYNPINGLISMISKSLGGQCSRQPEYRPDRRYYHESLAAYRLQHGDLLCIAAVGAAGNAGGKQSGRRRPMGAVCTY